MHVILICNLLMLAGNFMLVNDHDKAPLKAIDFGLAATFQSASEPRSDLGLEGTPWYVTTLAVCRIKYEGLYGKNAFV